MTSCCRASSSRSRLRRWGWLLLLWSLWPAFGFDHAHTPYARVLERYVSVQGVNYAGLKNDAADLRAYLDGISRVTAEEFESWARPQQLAFLLNLYNAATLGLVLDHYPVPTIRKIGGLFRSPWKLPIVRLWGGVHSLDWLEHEIIRPRYQEPRTHFALVCAARGCPPLRLEPYLAERLEKQLDDQGRSFLRQADKNRLDAAARTLYLSPLFKWYGDEFRTEAGTLEAFVGPFLNPADAAALAQAKVRITFTKYDWTLNEAPMVQPPRSSSSTNR